MERSVSLYSVDVFDTLVYRLTYTPLDVFRLLETVPGVQRILPDFAKIRVESEEVARSIAHTHGIEEVTIDDIYTALRSLTTCSAEEVAYLKAVEIELELSLVHLSSFGKEFLEELQSNNARFVVTSDMYLPKGVVEALLARCGITGYEALFLSSETLKTKHSGTAFDLVRNHFGSAGLSITHVGDNPYSDVANAKAKEFLTRQIFPKNLVFRSDAVYKTGSTILCGVTPLWQVFCSQYVEENHPNNPVEFLSLSAEDYGHALGACVLAPLLLSFSVWLADLAASSRIRSFLFESPGSELIMAVFKLIYGSQFRIDGLERLSAVTPIEDSFFRVDLVRKYATNTPMRSEQPYAQTLPAANRLVVIGTAGNGANVELGSTTLPFVDLDSLRDEGHFQAANLLESFLTRIANSFVTEQGRHSSHDVLGHSKSVSEGHALSKQIQEGCMFAIRSMTTKLDRTLLENLARSFSYTDLIKVFSNTEADDLLRVEIPSSGGRIAPVRPEGSASDTSSFEKKKVKLLVSGWLRSLRKILRP